MDCPYCAEPVKDAAIGMVSKAIAKKLGGEAAGFNVRTIQPLVSLAAAIGSVTMSIVTGLRQFF